MTPPLSIPLLLGTVRQGRQSEHVARYLHAKLVTLGVRSTFVDPRDLTLPMTDEGEDLKIHNPDYVKTISTADALLIIVPEYNRGYPGSLKRMLDICYDEYRNKPVGLVGVSSGIYGGTRGLAALLPVLKILGLIAMRRDLNVGPVSNIFSETDGSLIESKFEKQADQFLDELLAFANALQVLRK